MDIDANTTLDSLNDKIVNTLKADISDAENYQQSIIFPTVKERYEIYYADRDYYKKMMPRLSKVSSFVSTDVADTIEWALPSLMKVFCGGDSFCTITGVTEDDGPKAEIMGDLIQYQLQRQNNSFPIIYNWMKDALITGLGIVKCYWERQIGTNSTTVTLNKTALAKLQQTGVNITQVGPPDTFGDYQVTYDSPYYIKNKPTIENILINEFLYSSDAKTLKDANFVAHKKKVTMSYLRQMEQQGIYSNVEKVHPQNFPWNDPDSDEIAQVVGDQYYGIPDDNNDEARQKVLIYECYVKIDINGDGILEDMIITLCDDTILRMEPNYMGRHPFFDISPMKDPHRIWAKKSYAELIGEIQHVKIALERQILLNLALTNDPKMIMSPEGININDYIEGRAIIRKKAGFPMQDVVQSMPITPLSPYVSTFMEYLEGQKEERTGVTRYNQGLDASSLNKMLALDTPVPKIDGSYTTMGDIVAGDVLIGSDGQPTKVLKAHPVQFPKRAFAITFANGDVIRAGGEHRWSVKVSDKYYKHKSPEFEKLPTERIYDLMQDGCHVHIPRIGNVDFNHTELPMDPYVFGAWLGDGNSHTNRFTTQDKEVKDAFNDWALEHDGYIEESVQQNSGKATTYQLVDTPFRRILKDLHCLKDSRYEECKNNVKHIPDIYLRAPFVDRLALLQGLMDTDGCIDKNGNAIFCNSEPALINGFVALIESFGGKASINWNKNVTTPSGRPARDHAHVIFALPYCPVTIGYKVQRWESNHKGNSFKHFCKEVAIKSIQEIPVEPMRCLTVDSDDELYACGHHMTLTSNTASGINAIMNASNQRLELIARMFAETGFVDLVRFLIGLNQKFIDQNTVIRVTNKSLNISPEDINGSFDLDVSTGVSMATSEAQMQSLQTILTGVMQCAQAGVAISTPENIYNIFKKWAEAAGFKNYADYITDPEIIQQKSLMETLLKQRTLAALSPIDQAFYFQFGILRPQVLMQLPPPIAALFGGDASDIQQPVFQQGQTQSVGNAGSQKSSNGTVQGGSQFGAGGGIGGQAVVPTGGMVQSGQRNDNRRSSKVSAKRSSKNQDGANRLGSY